MARKNAHFINMLVEAIIDYDSRCKYNTCPDTTLSIDQEYGKLVAEYKDGGGRPLVHELSGALVYSQIVGWHYTANVRTFKKAQTQRAIRFAQHFADSMLLDLQRIAGFEKPDVYVGVSEPYKWIWYVTNKKIMPAALLQCGLQTYDTWNFQLYIRVTTDNAITLALYAN